MASAGRGIFVQRSGNEVMLLYRYMRSLQKLDSMQFFTQNHFNRERHLNLRYTLKVQCGVDLDEWQKLWVA